MQLKTIRTIYLTFAHTESRLDVEYDKTTTNYKCKKIKCSCIPDRMLCGKDGSVSKWSVSLDRAGHPAMILMIKCYFI